MKKIAAFILSLFTVMTGYSLSYTPSTDPDNLISSELFKKQLSWVDPVKLWTCHDDPDAVKVQNEILTISSEKSRPCIHPAEYRI